MNRLRAPGRGQILRRLAGAWWRDRYQFKHTKVRRHCPICDYAGVFISTGQPSTWDTRCAGCGSRPRHRLLHLYLQENGIDLDGKRILHFGPERYFIELQRDNRNYQSADLFASLAKNRLDMTSIDRDEGSFDFVIAHHVLEHIDDDRKAMAELFRVLKQGGIALLSVPINLSRDETYENPSIVDSAKRFVHFAGTDHRRFYGADFADRLNSVGFSTLAYRRPMDEEVHYGLKRDECIFIGHKPAA
ncbi:class I SAM-dependent methyltransferase [Fodinicurvata sp. EGI_FJ10296]|uniref:class I SAM-dependent methyltransferase n=1 Tax=Fodinicurvata sp. EGI_FJ10296 TaxID=3231908 RepID=UPI0034512D12